MAWYEIWKSPTIIQQLNKHLKGMSFEQKVEALKAIIPLVCPGAHISLNPLRGTKKTRKPRVTTADLS